MKIENVTNRLIMIYIVILLPIILLIIFLLSVYSINEEAKKAYKIQPYSNNLNISYSNLEDIFSFLYPVSYMLNSTKQEGNTLVELEKDVRMEGNLFLDSENYFQSKGVSIRVMYFKNYDPQKRFIDGGLTKKTKKVDGYNAIETTHGNSHPLNVPYVTRVQIYKGKDVLEISSVVGKNVTKEEYNTYIKEYNEIVDSTKLSVR